MENEENSSPPTSSPSASNQVILAKSDVREVIMEGVSRETQMSIAASSTFPGFRFSPTDVELISYYLQKKLDGYDKCVEIISEIDICRFEPWDLPAKSVIQSDNDWFFFSARGRKYPNGSQSKRTTELGYWKATGKERNVKSGLLVIGTKRILVFHIGRAPKGERTEWIMHEYCMNGKPQDSMVVCRLHRNNEFRLTNNSNNASPSQGHVPATHNSDLTLVDGAIDQTGVIDVDKAGESCPKKCSSSNSYEPHSVEQLDSASESEQKLSREGTLAESSSCQKDSDDEDFYADILKDEIVKLDETSLSAIPKLDHPVISTTKPEAERISQQPAQATSSQTQTPQGTADRRIKLRKKKLRSAHSHDLEKIPSGGEYSPGKIKDLNYGKMPKSLLRVLSAKAVKHRFVCLLFFTMSLLVLLLPLWGGGKQIQRFTNGSLSSGFWHQM